MVTEFRYVRSKNNPLFIIMCGYSDFTGLFDSTHYEQIVGPLPSNAEVYEAQDEKSALFALFLSLPVEYRAVFYGLVVQINHAMLCGDFEAAGLLLQLTPAPPELVQLKNHALEFFNIINRDSTISLSDSVVDEVVS